MKLETLMEEKKDGLKLWANNTRRGDQYTITTDPDIYQWHELKEGELYLTFNEYSNAKKVFDLKTAKQMIVFIQKPPGQLILPWVF